MPSPPDDLREEGRRLWYSVTAAVAKGEYVLRPDDWYVLGRACYQADLVEAVRGQIDPDKSFFMVGSAGGVISNPLLREYRGQVALLASLLKQMGLPDLTAESGEAEKSGRGFAVANQDPTHQAKAVQARWGHDRRRAEE